MTEQAAKGMDLGLINALLVSASAKNQNDRRESIFSLEDKINETLSIDPDLEAEIPVKHRFSGDMYMREITIPAGTLLTGRIHKFDHFDIMLSGKIMVSTDDGEPRIMEGLHLMEGKAGKKRAGYALEDTHWITVHSAQERNPEEMYEFLTCGTFEELGEFYQELSRYDYGSMLKDLGMVEEVVLRQVQNKDDMMDANFDPAISHIMIQDSKIQGLGAFAKKAFSSGDVIAAARIGEKRTIAGRYTNHAYLPNAQMVVTSEGVDLVALEDIPEGEEITVSYRKVLDSRLKGGDLCQQ